MNGLKFAWYNNTGGHVSVDHMMKYPNNLKLMHESDDKELLYQ